MPVGRQLKRILVLLMVMIPLSVVVLLFAMFKLSPQLRSDDHSWFKTGGDGLHAAEHPGSVVFKEERPINVLVLGLDVDWDDVKHVQSSANARSDTMFVLQFWPHAEHVGMLSLPRDLWVEMPGDNGSERINAAYSLGKVPYAKEVTEKLLGIQIDKYTVVRIELAKKIVDELGGITVDVEKDMDYDDNWGLLHVHLKKGKQTLMGEQAIGYARFRHDEEGDRGRMRRQQQVVDALIKTFKAKTQGINAVPIVRDMAHLFRTYIETDISLGELIDLGLVYKNFDRKNMRSGRIDGEDTNVGGAEVIIPPDRRTIERTVGLVLGGPGAVPTKPEDLFVEVFNGSTVRNAAGQMRDELVRRGMQVSRIEDFPGKTPPAHSLAVIHGDGYLATAVKRWFPNIEVKIDSDYPDNSLLNSTPGTHVSLILGQDWKTPVQ